MLASFHRSINLLRNAHKSIYSTFALSVGILFLARCHFMLSTGSAPRELSISYGRKERSALAPLQRIE